MLFSFAHAVFLCMRDALLCTHTGGRNTLHCCYTHGAMICGVFIHVCACACFFGLQLTLHWRCGAMQSTLAQEVGICEQVTMQLEALQKKYA